MLLRMLRPRSDAATVNLHREFVRRAARRHQSVNLDPEELQYLAGEAFIEWRDRITGYPDA